MYIWALPVINLDSSTKLANAMYVDIMSDRHHTFFPRNDDSYFDSAPIDPSRDPSPLIAKQRRVRLHKRRPQPNPSHDDVESEPDAETPTSDNLSSKRLAGTKWARDKRLHSLFCKTGSPWAHYRKIAELGRSESSFLCASTSWQPHLMVIRVLSGCEGAQRLIRTSHPNIVTLMEAFAQDNMLYMVYERMDVSLERLHSCIHLEEAHMATICREVSTLLGSMKRELNAA
jgi:hypothetical protein